MIYSTPSLREDNWDAGGWAWKNYRTAESAPVKSTNRDPNEIVSELTPQQQDIIVFKQKPSATAARPATPSACATCTQNIASLADGLFPNLPQST